MKPFSEMTKEQIIHANLDLLDEFMKYATEHPDLLIHIPTDAQLIILPENNPELLAANKHILELCKREQKKYVVFSLSMPQRSVPHLQESC